MEKWFDKYNQKNDKNYNIAELFFPKKEPYGRRNYLESGQFVTRQQDDRQASTAPKLTDADCALDFTKPSAMSINQVRGLAPRPGAVAIFRENRVKILALLPHNDASLQRGVAGGIVALDKSLGPIVQTGEGAVLIGIVQPAGKKPLTGAEFARGYRPEVGELFQTPSPK